MIRCVKDVLNPTGTSSFLGFFDLRFYRNQLYKSDNCLFLIFFDFKTISLDNEARVVGASIVKGAKKMKRAVIGLICIAALTGCSGNRQDEGEHAARSTETTEKSTTGIADQKSTAETTSADSASEVQSESTAASQTPTAGSDLPGQVSQVRNLVGSWYNPAGGLMLTVDASGAWKIEGGNYGSGILKVGLDSGYTQLVKLYSYAGNNQDTGIYFTCVYNAAGSKMNFGELGTFERQEDPQGTLEGIAYWPQTIRQEIDLATSLPGTWQTADRDAANYQQINFNPDGTFESFSENRGEWVSGHWLLDSQQGSAVQLNMSYDDGVTDNAEWTLTEGTLSQPGHENYTLLRNLTPSMPE